MKYLIAFGIVLFSLKAQAQQDFIVKPYLQIGKEPSSTSMDLLWHTLDEAADWTVDIKTPADKAWVSAFKISFTPVAIAGINKFRVYKAQINNLVAGKTFEYRVSKNGKTVFTDISKAPKSYDQPFRFVTSGDMGAGTKEAKQIANGIYKVNPDFVAIAGDLVYEYGLISEYKTKFWPIYNADKADSVGVPLMRSVPFIGAMGNHDADSRDLDQHPDALAYYLFWDQPINGPVGNEGGKFVPLLKGSEANSKAFKDAAGDKYPRMANFSFNYGNSHWTILDSDTYVEWADSSLTAWVARDLADSKDATWHFVMYHHPGFHSSVDHFEQQQMRLLAPVLEKGNVDIVFSGHVHNYERTFPMHFAPDKKGVLLVGGKENKTIRGRMVNGRWTLDKKFDGKINTIPRGVIYMVTGAGGQELYNPEQENDPDTWQKFTVKFISTVHTFTVADVNGKKLTIRQLNASGKEMDKFTITKN